MAKRMDDPEIDVDANGQDGASAGKLVLMIVSRWAEDTSGCCPPQEFGVGKICVQNAPALINFGKECGIWRLQCVLCCDCRSMPTLGANLPDLCHFLVC
jgi:hypothetical protein